MSQFIELLEKDLYVRFEIRDDGIVELNRFRAGRYKPHENLEPENTQKDCSSEAGKNKTIYPIMEVNVTGKTTREMHGYKHNAGSASGDFRYVTHIVNKLPNADELVITLKTEYDVYAYYHMTVYQSAPVVRVYTTLENKGQESLALEYVSSFIYQNVCGEGEKSYFDKTDVYIP